MKSQELSISGSWLCTADVYSDSRGFFTEWYKSSEIHRETRLHFSPVQANTSLSAAGVVRGIHYSLAPQGQAKLISVMRGSILDVVVDIRVGSPTFGQHQTVQLSSGQGHYLLLSNHLGHGFQALENDTVVSYLVSSEYSPTDEKEISPLCPRLGITWFPDLHPLLSDKDRDAPGLDEQQASGLLPIFQSLSDTTVN